MQPKENLSIFEISSTDTARFRRIVIDVMTEACRLPLEDDVYDGIGTLGEKQMHAAIKRFICPDESKHEILIDGSAGCIERACDGEDNKKQKKRRFVADVLDGNTIYEIQTGGFSPLRDKIAWILENTTYNVMVIHPIAETKWVSTINNKTGSIENRKKSPLKGRVEDIASELYFFRDFIASPRFSLVILMMEGEQYKKNMQTDGRKRPRYRKYELIPISLLRAYIFKGVEDYKLFLPEGLPNPFCVKNYSEKTKIRGMDAYSIVKTLMHLGLVEEHGNLGKAAAYKICDRELDPPAPVSDEPQKKPSAPKRSKKKSAETESKTESKSKKKKTTKKDDTV
ncbi:MAG: hypothetical protein IJY39_02950 [Clostridia bacterium]|nr:hypothetical protein [Clostridia bacterium]